VTWQQFPWSADRRQWYDTEVAEFDKAFEIILITLHVMYYHDYSIKLWWIRYMPCDKYTWCQFLFQIQRNMLNVLHLRGNIQKFP